MVHVVRFGEGILPQWVHDVLVCFNKMPQQVRVVLQRVSPIIERVHDVPKGEPKIVNAAT